MENRGVNMAKLIAFYSRAGENYFSGQYRTVPVGNTEKVANRIAAETGETLFRIEQKTPMRQTTTPASGRPRRTSRPRPGRN